jgi:hypothetical protein
MQSRSNVTDPACMMMKTKYWISAFLIGVTGLFSGAQDLDSGDFDFFASEAVLHITLRFDMREFIRTKKEPANLDAVLTIQFHEGDTLSQPIKIKARGEMRRNYCSFPPIMLKFKNSVDTARHIRGKGNLKLVTHCNRSDMYKSYVFKEYLAYKLYNQVTPYSFRTRLVQINYVDIRNPKHSLTAYGFLIENEDRLAERNNAVIIDNDHVSQKHMNEEDMARVALFNYMIGNTDWSVIQQHNIKVLMPQDTFTNQGIPVAYDFDYSGFVKTVYSAPTKGLPIKNVTERYYLGTCVTLDEMEPVLEQFDGLKDGFIRTINEFGYLSENSKKKLEYYINGFYKVYKHQNILISQLNRTCRKY